MQNRLSYWKKLSCLALAILYTTFLSSQVVYNIASAHSDPVKLRAKHFGKARHRTHIVQPAKKKHAALLSKANSRPVKRFHPKTAADIAITGKSAAPVPAFVFNPPGYNSPFFSSHLLQCPLLRGPPRSC